MKTFSQVAITLFGLLTGGMVLIALGLVPYWRSLDPAEFTVVFAASLPTVGGTMKILTVLATGSMVVAAILATVKKLPTRNLLIAGAICSILMLITVIIYFGQANPTLAKGALSAADITAELATWQQMHWVRTVIGVIGLFCAVRAGFAQSSQR